MFDHFYYVFLQYLVFLKGTCSEKPAVFPEKCYKNHEDQEYEDPKTSSHLIHVYMLDFEM